MWLSTWWGSYFVITSVFCFDLPFLAYLSHSFFSYSLVFGNLDNFSMRNTNMHFVQKKNKKWTNDLEVVQKMLITTGGIIIKYMCVIWTLNKNVVKLLPFSSPFSNFSLLMNRFSFGKYVPCTNLRAIYKPFTNTMDHDILIWMIYDSSFNWITSYLFVFVFEQLHS